MKPLRTYLRRLRLALGLAALGLLVVAPTALAVTNEGANAANTIFLSPVLVWTLLVAAGTPLIGYVVNSRLWASAPEWVKGGVTALITGISTGVTEAITSNSFGFNNVTLGLILIAELAAFRAWHPVWKATEIQARLVRPPGARR